MWSLLPGTIGMQRQVPGSRNQAPTNKTLLNRDNENNGVVLGEEEWEDLFGNSMGITSFNEFSYEWSNKDDISINHNNKERQTWRKTFNTAVMECYFLSRPVDEECELIRQYRRMLGRNWKEQYGTKMTEQSFCDQAKMIRKNELITKMEFENIKRYFKKKKRCTSKQWRMWNIQRQ